MKTYFVNQYVYVHFEWKPNVSDKKEIINRVLHEQWDNILNIFHHYFQNPDGLFDDEDVDDGFKIRYDQCELRYDDKADDYWTEGVYTKENLATDPTAKEFFAEDKANLMKILENYPEITGVSEIYGVFDQDEIDDIVR